MTHDIPAMHDVSNRMRRLGLLATIAVVISGCYDDGLSKRYPVSGTVSYNGKPVEKGVITFISDGGDGRSATGTIEGGSYSLTTLTPGDGAFPGKYKVTVDSRSPDMAAAEAAGKAKGATSVMIPQDFVAKAYKKAKSAVPSKYNSVGKTDLTAEVKEGNNTFPFDLKD
ncbi:hypothetical protein ACYOEI_02965 [Singulisphaera rosea]